MPLYEFYCPPCGVQFEILRPMSRLDEPATCPSGHTTSNRVISLFATMRKTAEGEVESMSQGGACCAGGACACGNSFQN